MGHGTDFSLSFPSTSLGFYSLGCTRSLIEMADFRVGVGKVQDKPGTSYCANQSINQSVFTVPWGHATSQFEGALCDKI